MCMVPGTKISRMLPCSWANGVVHYPGHGTTLHAVKVSRKGTGATQLKNSVQVVAIALAKRAQVWCPLEGETSHLHSPKRM